MRLLFAVLFLSALACAESLPAGEITGRVSVKPEPATRRPKRYYMGPHRSGLTHAAPDSGTPALNAVVYLEGADARPGMRPPPPEPVMRQKDETFIPHVLPILAGTRVAFPNEDDFYHNVFSVVAGDRFDLGRYAEGNRTSNPFAKTGVVVVRCEIHPGMKAYILVLDTPAFVVPSEDGAFSFSGMKAGRYTLRAWHPTAGEWSRTIDLPENGRADVDVAF